MYDPLKHHDVKVGMSVAIVGCGGLASMGLQLAKAMGATVTAISTSPQIACVCLCVTDIVGGCGLA